MLFAEGIGKRFGSRWIFRGLQFSVASGQVLGVFGANGSGKSTLLRLVAGLNVPSEGKIRIDGESDDLRQSIGYAALDLALYPDLSASEHLTLATQLRGSPSNTDSLLERVNLPKDQPSREFSSGMRARLRLALAIQHAPKVLLLDEPSASLDKEGRDLVQQIIQEQTQRGVVIIATNDPQEKEWAHHAITLG